MNKTFVFPRPQQPAVRPQPRVKASAEGEQGDGGSRDSNALRASVLDAAMELGLGNNSVVANWMFSNAVEEEDETETNKAGANGSSSQRDEPTSGPGVHFAPQSTVHAPIGGGEDNSRPIVFRTSSGPGAALGLGKTTGTGLPVAFPEGMPPPPPASSTIVFPTKEKPSKDDVKKLKKKKSTANDGYESDGGYMSEGGGKKKDKKKKDKKKDVIEEDGAMLSPGQPGERTRKKSFVEAMKSSTKKKEKEKSKKEAETGYETDGGTKKSKRSFFKLSGKSSKGDLAASTLPQADPNDVPALPTLTLPIHERFATPFPIGNASFSSSIAESIATATLSSSTAAPPSYSPRPSIFPTLSAPPTATPTPAESPTSYLPPPSALSNPHLDLGLDLRRDSQMSTGSSSSGGSASRAATSSRTSHSSAGKIHDATSPSIPPAPALDLDLTRSISPAFSTMSITSFRSPSESAGLKPVIISSPLARTPSPIPPSTPTPAPSQPVSPQEDNLKHLIPSQTHTWPPPMSSPPVAPLNLDKAHKGGLRIKPSLEKLNLLSRNKEKAYLKEKDEHTFTETLLVPQSTASAQPSPVSPASPYVLVTSVQTSPTTSDTLPQSESTTVAQSNSSQIERAPSPSSPPQSTSPLIPRSRNARPLSPPEGSAPSRAFISAPNTAVSSPVSPSIAASASATLPMPQRSRPANLNLSPDDDHLLGPNPARYSPLTSPNVLAYYDIPPPSPPPSGPLPIPPRGPTMDSARSPSPSRMIRRPLSPNVPLPAPRSGDGSGSPPVANAVPAQFPTPAQLRQRMLDRGMRPPPPSAALPIQRGRESPFPTRRMVPSPMVSPSTAGLAASTMSSTVRSPEKSEKHARFAEDPVTSRNSKRRSWIDFDYDDLPRSSEGSSNEIEIRVSTSDDDGVSGEGTQESWLPYEEPEIRSEEGEIEDSGFQEVIERFTPRDEGSEEGVYSGRALGRSRSSEALSANLSANKDGDFAWDDKATLGDRTSRWSGSIYSRVSILDEEKSMTTRDLFVKRVEAMLAGKGDSSKLAENGSGMAGIGSRNFGRGGANVFVPPPVPRIPDMYVNGKADMGGSQKQPLTNGPASLAGRNWNKF